MRGMMAPMALVLLLSGCGSAAKFGPARTDEPCLGTHRIDDAAVVKALDAMPVTDLAALKYHPVRAEGAGYSIGMDAPVAEVAGSRSRVVALDLTGYAPDHLYLLPLKSGVSAPPTLECGAISFVKHFGHYGGAQGIRVIYPRVMWLNEAKQPIGEGSSEHKTVANPALIARVTRFARPAEARYAVVFSERARLGELFTVESATIPEALSVVVGPLASLAPATATRRDTYVAVSTGGIAHVPVHEGTGPAPAPAPAEYDPSPKPVKLRLEAKYPAKVWWGGHPVP